MRGGLRSAKATRSIELMSGGAMEIIISIAGEDCQEELLSFYEWFMDDGDIRGSADIELVEAQPQAGSMAVSSS